MNQMLIEKISMLVEDKCKQKTNTFGYGIWSHHIKPMVDIAIDLAKEYGADLEIVIIATLLHDLAGINDEAKIKEHHIFGTELAEEILEKENYPKEKIEQVKKCILNHRGSVVNKKESKEELCVADADAIAHIRAVGSLFYVAYKKNLTIDEGKEWVKAKIRRDYNKLSEMGKLKFESDFKEIERLIL
jgi:uncharacterized protein